MSIEILSDKEFEQGDLHYWHSTGRDHLWGRCFWCATDSELIIDDGMPIPCNAMNVYSFHYVDGVIDHYVEMDIKDFNKLPYAEKNLRKKCPLCTEIPF